MAHHSRLRAHLLLRLVNDHPPTALRFGGRVGAHVGAHEREVVDGGDALAEELLEERDLMEGRGRQWKAVEGRGRSVEGGGWPVDGQLKALEGQWKAVEGRSEACGRRWKVRSPRSARPRRGGRRAR